jgi:8-oxo-dGTP pyrophosphatase MutT (NUDIX family)
MSLDKYVKEVNTFLFTQVHCVCNNHVLLMKRNKEPNYGLWVAPGGKIEKYESPYECAIRELREETGLSAQTIQLRGIVSIVSPKIEHPCMQFLYLVTWLTDKTREVLFLNTKMAYT